jgi:hypothetical protein
LLLLYSADMSASNRICAAAATGTILEVLRIVTLLPQSISLVTGWQSHALLLRHSLLA